MKIALKHGALISAMATLPLLPGCSTQQTNTGVSMANPASKYCLSQGGRLEIVRDASGNERGMCHLPDRTVIDEWALFRRDQSKE